MRVTNGSYNVIGIDEGSFIVQGNLTREQLLELVAAAKAELKAK